MTWKRTSSLLLGCFLLTSACVGDQSDAGDLPGENSDAAKVGAIIPLSGEYEALGGTQRVAFALAQEDARRQGRPTLNLMFGDSQLRDLKTQRQYRRMVNEDKVVAFVEITGNSLALMLEELAAKDKVPILSGIDTHPRLTRGKGTYFFRVIPSDAASSAVLSQWALEEKLGTAALVHDESDWAAGFRDALLGAYRTQGGNLPADAVVTVKEDVTDFAAAVSALRRQSPEVCFVGLTGKQAGLFVKQAVAGGFSGAFLGGQNLANQAFADAAGNAKTRVRLVLPTEGNSAASQRFKETYRAKTGEEPDLVAIKSYETYMVMLSAVEAVQRAGRPLTGEEIRKALEGLQIEGLTGTLSFDRYHDLRQPRFDRFTFDASGARVPAS